MKKILNLAKHAVIGEDGASNVEIIVWISVVLVIGTVLFLLRDSIIGFIKKAINVVDGFKVS